MNNIMVRVIVIRPLFQTYMDCACVPVLGNASVSMVTLGSCGSSCSMLYAFLAVLFVYTFTTIAADVPAEQAVLR